MNVLLVHGAFQHKQVWDNLKKKLSRPGVHVVAIDMPDHGSKRHGGKRVTLENYVSEIELTLKQTYNKEQTCLVCHSFAGIYGAVAASRCLSVITCIVFLAANIAEQGETPYDLLSDCPEFQKELKQSTRKNNYIRRDKNTALKYFANNCSKDIQDMFCDQILCDEPALPYFGIVSYATDWKIYLDGRIYYYRGTEDKPIDKVRATRYASRAGTSVREIKGDHQLMLSNPEGLSDEIIRILQS